MQVYPFFVTHAGCPQRCLFCRQEVISGVGDSAQPGDVGAALEKVLPERGDGEVAFYGGSFTLQPAARQIAFFEAVRPYLESGRLGGIRISTRPDGLDPSQVDLLRRHGVRTVEIGCQSFAPEVLETCRRGYQAEAVVQAAARVRAAGLRLGLQLMPGLPGGGPREAFESLARALALKPDFLRIYPAVVLKGTGLERLWRQGGFRPLELEEAVEVCAEMLWICHGAGVPVIRMGLQATTGLNDGSVIAAGPYHPAFGQLVRSQLWQRALRRATLQGECEISVHPADFSDAIGHRRKNLQVLQSEFGFIEITRDERIPRGALACSRGRFPIMDLAFYED
ncbi:radical SAM protein [Desulfuromonas versatilis]|uniref:Radical SAM protein n=1 Tax=Desulfuromonas versatilis TaxID=2802975 RepID=A0ABN6DYC6_9BACT|nr:radical SAM protein [Desulfuromonas versatilis]BCR05131.1 radical SAM protein [Desulfuromonas versatilis]